VSASSVETFSIAYSIPRVVAIARSPGTCAVQGLAVRVCLVLAFGEDGAEEVVIEPVVDAVRPEGSRDATCERPPPANRWGS
jgi:hypothetical protein